MLSYITIDDTTGTPVDVHRDTAASKRVATKVTGLVGANAPRRTTRPRPQGHGALIDTRWSDSNLIVIEGETFSQDGVDDALAEFRAIVAAVAGTLDTAPALLKWQEDTAGLALQKTVVQAGEMLPVLYEAAAIVRYQLQLEAGDPRAYSQTQTTVTGDVLSTSSGGKTYRYTYPRGYFPSSGGQAAVVNSGNVPTPPVLRVYGQCTAPRVRLLSTGQEIVLTGTIAAGDYMEIDVAQRTVKLNGATLRNNLLDFASTSWWEIPPGSQTVQLLAGTFDASARCDVISRSAYR